AEDGIRDFHVTGVQTCALPISLMAAARRLLWRAALFLWMMFLSAMRSMTLEVLRNTSFAAAWSPAAMAWRTRLIDVRSIERRLALCLLRATDWRARLRGRGVLARLAELLCPVCVARTPLPYH